MKQWSTKDLHVLEPATGGRAGDAVLTFTDRYSVFDHGVMPDLIPGKGRATCAMAVLSFGLFERAGITTHFVEQVAEDAIRIRLLGLDLTGSRRTGPAQLIPLQIVYRRQLRPESSVHRRVATGAVDPASIPPMEPETGRLDPVMVEFTSKFEETDRFLDPAAATRVGHISPADLTGLTEQARRVCAAVDEHCVRVGLTLVDGKTEYGFDEHGDLMLVDHAGTPDENRFYFEDTPVCKELLRALYPELRERVQGWVRDGLPRSRWPRPQPLGPDLVAAVAEVYAAVAQVWVTGASAARARLSAAVKTYLAGCPSVEPQREHRR
ncbi:phosphoribosylaminoimidazolesuccinocarboxamide synthase [Salinispora arenicola]|uniref:phosphoribosylaminoimidazolesuccinocarboxamide synthase n=1 Tax=Salinispora arenicola (strain CNS-205) TaxID=391037 RepID=A8M136_SALAI|nr:phosphoribosylaminoimidazolesuccinocarboxamide synthase [Salinispora arenicola]MCN0177305.1 phosphoribosylaminoimidazolesuccinocarboxamide synthase [Salinispora arenicola]